MMFLDSRSRDRRTAMRWAALITLTACGAIAVPSTAVAAPATTEASAGKSTVGGKATTAGKARADAKAAAGTGGTEADAKARSHGKGDEKDASKTADSKGAAGKSKDTDKSAGSDAAAKTSATDKVASADKNADKGKSADKAKAADKGADVDKSAADQGKSADKTGAAGKHDRTGKDNGTGKDDSAAKDGKGAGLGAADGAADGAAVPGSVAQHAGTQACAESANVDVSAAWADASIPDNTATKLEVTISRIDTCGAATGLGYAITLPAGLVKYSGSPESTCDTVDITATNGTTTLVVADAQLADTVASCVIKFPVGGSSSGQYDFTAASITSVTGLAKAQTTQTLTITTATPRVTAVFVPPSIAANGAATLGISVGRTDQNALAVSNGLGFTMTLPTGVVVGSGSATNDCGGTLTATVGAGAVTLSGGSLSGASADCGIEVPVTSGVPGTHTLSNSSVSNASGVVPQLTSLCAENGTAPNCAPTLTVQKLTQTINFPQPSNWSISKQTVVLNATATSGLAVTYDTNTPSVCTVSGGVVTLVTTGACEIAADQVGNSSYQPASQVTRTFTVSGPVPAPASVVAIAGVSQIRAQWQAPGDLTGVTGYTAIASPGQARCTTESAAVTNCVMGGTAGVTYTVTVITNTALGDSAAAGPSNGATPTAPPVSAAPPETDLLLTTDKGRITTAVPNQDIVVIGTGFMPYSTAKIVIYSTPIELGTAITDGLGNFSKPVKVPANLAVGGHQLVASGIDPSGNPHNMKMAIRVRGSADSLAVTGPPIMALLLLGTTTALLGGTLLLATRRRATPTP
ncbi:hypothetical protein ACFFX1_13455 [Dactylosporangium sucinum]|nr:hypothetical protein [Dactylosporangium sucinum]